MLLLLPQAVEDPAARRAVYDEVVEALRSAEDNRLAAGLAEQAFIDLLQGARGGGAVALAAQGGGTRRACRLFWWQAPAGLRPPDAHCEPAITLSCSSGTRLARAPASPLTTAEKARGQPREQRLRAARKLDLVAASLAACAEVTPPIAPDSTWPRVKPLLWRDYRYLALAEPRRKALFDEMHAVVCEQAKQQQPAAAAAAATATLVRRPCVWLTRQGARIVPLAVTRVPDVDDVSLIAQEVPQPAAPVVAAEAAAVAATPAAAPAAEPRAVAVAAVAAAASAVEPEAVAAAAGASPVAPAVPAAAAAEGQPAGAAVNPVLLEELRKQQVRGSPCARTGGLASCPVLAAAVTSPHAARRKACLPDVTCTGSECPLGFGNARWC